MSRITFTEGIVFAGKGLLIAGIGGAGASYFTHEVCNLFGIEQQRMVKIKNCVSRVIFSLYLVVPAVQLIFCVYYKTSPSETYDQALRKQILRLFPQLNT